MRVQRFILNWVALALLYFLFAGKMSFGEAVAAFFAGLIIASGLKAVREGGKILFHLKAAWVLLLLRKIPVSALRDCILVLKAAYKSIFKRDAIQGNFVTIPFDPGGGDPKSAARRAMVAAGITFSPNSIAVVIDREKGSILIHQLKEAPVSTGKEDRSWPL